MGPKNRICDIGDKLVGRGLKITENFILNTNFRLICFWEGKG